MGGDGDGWAACAEGHRHWGRHGAAGLLLRRVDDRGERHVLLQHRAAWSHHGDTWGLPGGARDSHESAREAALREAAEEVGLDPSLVEVTGEWADDHGGWCYTTVLARCRTLPRVRPTGGESIAVRWVTEAEMPGLPLHPGLAATWPLLPP